MGSKLNISGKGSNQLKTSDKNCSYCHKPFSEELWCKECDPRCIIEGWTSENPSIDKFINDTIYNAGYFNIHGEFLEWVPFDRFTDIKQIGESGFAKVYSATWRDGKAKYEYSYPSWKKLDSEPIKVALKRLNESQNTSEEHLNKVYLIYILHIYTVLIFLLNLIDIYFKILAQSILGFLQEVLMDIIKILWNNQRSKN